MNKSAQYSSEEWTEDLEQLRSDMTELVDEVETKGAIPESKAQSTHELVDEIMEERRNQ